MANNTVRIAVILSAMDRMSSVINRSTQNAERRLGNLAKNKFMQGTGLVASGVALAASMAPAVKAYAELEEAQMDLQASMMKANGSIDSNFKGISTLAEDLGNKLPGTTADFFQLFKVMMNNGVQSQNILNGVGKAAAYLAVDLKMPYAAAGEFAARMKQATGVADSEMLGFMDTISRANSLGIDASEMQYAFGRSSGSLKNLGLQGLNSANQMTVLYASLIRAGQSGETAATSFNSIVTNLLNADKFAKVTAEAGRLGISLQFFKDGKFLGIEHMISQLDKLKGFNVQERSKLVNLLTGGGQDAQALNTLITNGTAGYAKMRSEMEAKGRLNDKVNLKLKGLNSLWEAATGTITNMLASLGAGLMPILGPIVELIGMVAGKIKDFLTLNPGVAKFIALVVSLAGVFLTLMGAVKILGAIRVAATLLNITLAANPFILIASAAILAVGLIYANWGKIKGWFASLWANIKIGVQRAWDFVKGVFLKFHPLGIIIKNWQPIFNFFRSIGTRFRDAGRNIITSITAGMAAVIMKPVEVMQKMVLKVRRLLPFSPAKDGPLKDIHRIKLVETIAASIKPGPLVGAMRGVAGAAANVAAPARGGGGGITFAPVIHLNGSATTADGAMITAAMRKEFEKMMAQYFGSRQRLQLG